MKPRQKRTAIILGGLVGLGIVVALVLNAFQGNLVFFLVRRKLPRVRLLTIARFV